MLYESATWVIVAALLLSTILANEIGFRAGRRKARSETEETRSVSNALKGSVLGLVALLLAFSFSATAARYDLRQRVALDQANAVGTCYLRAGLLDRANADRVRSILRDYVELRLSLGESLSVNEHASVQAKIDDRLDELWTAVESVNQERPDDVRNSFIVPAANDVIDLSSTRAWADRNHLPDLVLILLLVGVLICAFLLGHSSGQTTVRHAALWTTTNLVFALVMFVVLDFDRPRRGLIKVDQSSLTQLRSTMERDAAEATK